MKKTFITTIIALFLGYFSFGQGIPYTSTVGPAHYRDLSAQMISIEEGYILAYLDSTRTNTQLFFTNDVAASWTPRAMRGLPTTGTGTHFGVHFYTVEEGIYLTQYRIYRTVNGGDDWVLVFQPSSSYSMCHKGDTTYVVGSNGSYSRSYNRGQNWTARSWSNGNNVILGCGCDASEVSMWALPTPGLVVQQSIVRMQHGEISPYNFTLPANQIVWDIRGFAKFYQAFSALEMYRYSFGNLNFTTDGWASFTIPTQSTPGPFGDRNNFHWVDKNHGFKVVGNRVYRTYDGAENWTLLWQHVDLDNNRPIHVFSSPMGNYVHIAVLHNTDSNGIGILEVVSNTAFQGLSTAPRSTLAELTVYPNPTTTALRISGTKAGEVYELVVTDVNGKRMISYENWETSSELDVSGLAAGIYHFQLKSSSGFNNGRFIKQ